jgi:ankyrin repeat protein
MDTLTCSSYFAAAPKRGADVNLKDSEGNSALDYANLSHNTNAVELLVRAQHR